MGRPVVHFEIIGRDPAALRRFYAALFDWDFDTTGPVSARISDPGDYGFVTPRQDAPGSPPATSPPDGPRTWDEVSFPAGIPGGVGGGPGFEPHVLFYVGVPDVEATLRKAETLGATRRLAPDPRPGGSLVVAHLADPEGNLIGLAALTSAADDERSSH
ncbi:glyoxalase [Sphaerisporangium siamense]|uniref:Putative enzyme related to lactoylglutathione lyase n=1 Tax=Sphaerisporangium siamense TaxID=795645 RepID=A0A7W7DA64_9ACTN|nr:VOC family protein [Sphaerisporangium siamense]MBB4703097.1 putative enzyme related to lactoylglutathione lyase [Sphaerisporangium siamense]GII83139.1 glyoxalase [Sphaerisporangium siamense]